MSIPIDSREVYEYLQELGYKNISSTQLKEFIHDLKKLIKYEEKKKRKLYDKENIAQDNQEPKQKQDDIFQNLYETNTEASKAKIVQPKKDKIITVQIKKHKETCKYYKPSGDVETQTIDDYKKDESPLSENKETQVSQVSLNTKSDKTTSIKGSGLYGKHSDKTTSIKDSDKVGDGKKSSIKENILELKPKASFIRPKSLKTTKSDPVSLYHRYQAEWKKQKIPGVNNHSNLRWAIREKMLGDYEPSIISRPVAIKKKLSTNSRV